MKCRNCHKAGGLGPDDLCHDCRSKYGLLSKWPESRRLHRRCVRCDHGEFVRAAVRERGAGNWNSPRLAPLGVTFLRQMIVTAAGDSRPLNEPDLRDPAGPFEVYVCRGCGFTEWYALEPESVPIGAEYATELAEVGGREPRF